MRCPKCKQLVDPRVTQEWIEKLDQLKQNPSDLEILDLILAWDESTMEAGGQSTLPTELRDLVRNQIK